MPATVFGAHCKGRSVNVPREWVYRAIKNTTLFFNLKISSLNEIDHTNNINWCYNTYNNVLVEILYKTILCKLSYVVYSISMNC